MKILLSTLSVFILLIALSLSVSSSKAQSSLRLSRVAMQSDQFKGLSLGYSQRWLRNMRIPSFCRMNLCNGSCAETDAPCTLRTFHNLVWDAEPPACHHAP